MKQNTRYKKAFAETEVRWLWLLYANPFSYGSPNRVRAQICPATIDYWRRCTQNCYSAAKYFRGCVTL